MLVIIAKFERGTTSVCGGESNFSKVLKAVNTPQKRWCPPLKIKSPPHKLGVARKGGLLRGGKTSPNLTAILELLTGGGAL